MCGLVKSTLEQEFNAVKNHPAYNPEEPTLKEWVALYPLDLSNTWAWREHLRLIDGTYMPIDKLLHFMRVDPITFQFLHFTHQVPNRPNLISYTENREKGRRGIQTVCKIGKYLQKYKERYRLCKDDIPELAARYRCRNEPLELHFATTRTEIKEVYTSNSVRSCMNGPPSRFDLTHTHPAEVYATGDIAVAYATHKNNGVTKMVARTVINLVRKEYTKIYGDAQLSTILEKSGYTKGDLIGCRILKVKREDGWMAPYIDDTQGIIHHGTTDRFFKIVPNHDVVDYRADKTDGRLSEECPREVCNLCGDTYNEEHLTHFDSPYSPLCENCLKSKCVRISYSATRQDYLYEEDGDTHYIPHWR